MRKSIISMLMLMILLAGALGACGVRETVITDRSGRQFRIEAHRDSVVTFKDEDVVVTLDDRGKPSTLDELIKLYFMQWSAEQAKED